MSRPNSNLISADELHARLGDPTLVIVDTRFDLADPDRGRREYDEAHVPGSVFLDLDRDLSKPKERHGGRHPLPDMDAFVRTLERVGIGNDASVVVLDADTGMFAGRLWWMLRFLGHEDVRVLDGGLKAWREAGLPVTSDAPAPRAASFTARPRPEMIASMEEVRARVDAGGAMLIDARAPERYRGDVEPLDPKAGHIPGAVNLPFGGNLEGGRFRSADELRERFAAAQDAEEVIVYCGSGVSAAHDLIALEEAGVQGARLYVGSWSDWSSFDENPVATGDE